MQDFTHDNAESQDLGGHDQQTKSPGKPGKKGSSLLVDLVSLLLLLSAVFIWTEYRIDAAVEERIAEHLAESPHQKVAVLDYSEIQEAFADQIEKDQVDAFIMAKRDQIADLIKDGYIVLDGNTVIGAPRKSQYVVQP